MQSKITMMTPCTIGDIIHVDKKTGMGYVVGKILCKTCGRRFSTLRGMRIHRGRIHR